MEKKESAIKRVLWRPIYRTLRIDILTLFLSLFIISFTFVIFFSHIKQTRSIEQFSLGTVERASNIILERVKTIILDANRFPMITDSIIWDKNQISEDNRDLILYLLRVVQFENNFSHIFAATLEGNFLGANDLSLSSQHTFITHSSKLLPQNAKYSVLYVDSAVSPHKNTWYYFDKDLYPLCYEQSLGNEYDPRSRVWFEGAINAKDLYWSNVFQFLATGDIGVSVSRPLFLDDGTIFGVTGVELSFVLLSQFLSQQQVGKTGQTFLLHSDGQELISHENRQDLLPTISRSTLLEAYRQYTISNQNSFLFENEGIKYLAYVNSVPVVTGNHWLIMIIVPNSDFFSDIARAEEIVLLITLAVLILSALMVFYFSKRISSPIVILAKEVDKMKHLDLGSEVRVKSNIKEIMLMDASIASMRNGLRSFAKYVPKRIVKQLIEKGDEISLGGEKKEITVLFTDIAGFTTFSEANSADSVMAFLTEYFDALSKIIISAEGTIDKYIGDSIMAFWGAPLETPDHATRACTTAIRCQAFLYQFNLKRKQEAKPELFTRIEINSGTVIVGNIGTLERMNYTVIGDMVNAAAHLQQVNKLFHLKTLVTEETLKQTENRFLVRPLDIVAPTGKKTKIKVYELIALLEGEADIAATTEQKELCALFTQGFDAFHAGKREEAHLLFLQMRDKYPDDFPTQVYLERIEGHKSP